MFGIFGTPKKDAQIIETLTGMASVFRRDIEAYLFNYRFHTGIDIIKAFSLPTAIIYYHITQYYHIDRCKRIIDEIEQEAFNYTIAIHLKDKLSDVNSVKRAREDFRTQTDQFMLGIPNMLSKAVPSPELSNILPNSTVLEQAAYIFMYVCVVNQSSEDENYLRKNYRSFAISLERFGINIKIYLSSNK